MQSKKTVKSNHINLKSNTNIKVLNKNLNVDFYLEYVIKNKVGELDAKETWGLFPKLSAVPILVLKMQKYGALVKIIRM